MNVYNEKMIKKLINEDVLFTSDVSEIIGKTRQQVINLANAGKIKVAKNSKAGMLFLRGDIDNYLLNVRNGLLEGQNEIFDGSIKDSFEYIKNNISDINDIAYVKIYFSSIDAVVNGYFTCENINNQNKLMLLDTPSFIIGFNDIRKKELWISDLKCGYRGTGPRASIDILTNYLNISIPNIENLITNNDVVELYREDSIWIHKSITNNREPHIRLSQIYMFNKNKVMLYDDNMLNNAYETKTVIKNYEYFINNPKSIIFYSTDEAIKTGHNVYSTVCHELYQIIIKDNLGNELWIPGYIDEDLPLIEQNEVQTILSEAGLFVKQKRTKNILDILLLDNNTENLRNKPVIAFEIPERHQMV